MDNTLIFLFTENALQVNVFTKLCNYLFYRINDASLILFVIQKHLEILNVSLNYAIWMCACSVEEIHMANNNIKCGKLLIFYSKINCITNYTTTGKYCKLINCSAWWRLMSPTAPVVPFSNLLATVFFKKHNSLKKSRVGCNWCVLCRRIKHESILSLCEPLTLFKGFNQNPIQRTHWV